MERCYRDSPRGSAAGYSYAHALATVGRREGMEAVMTDDFRSKVSRDLQLMFYTSSIYALGGQREQACTWLRTLVDGGFRNYPWLTNDPWLSPYQDDLEFQGLFDEVREEWERNGGRPGPDGGRQVGSGRRPDL